MHITARSYLTAGVALVGAGAIALTPVQPMPAHLTQVPQRVVTDLAVNLAATVDPIQLWKDTIDTAAKNISNLHFSYWQVPDPSDPRPVPGPFPIISSIIYNQYVYFQEIPDFGKIFKQIGDNFQKFFSVQREVNLKTLDTGHKTIWTLLPQLIDIPPALKPLVDLTTTYSSGQLIGFFGPAISSTLALVDSIKGIFGAPNIQSAINEIINIPANQVNAFLNGGKTLDLTSLLSGLLPEKVTKAGITFGGLLSASPQTALAGSIFNSLDLGYQLSAPPKPPLEIPGVGAGVLASSIELGKQIGKAILVPNVPPFGAAAAPAAAIATAPAAATAKAPAAAASVSAPESTAPAVDTTPAAPAVDDTPAPVVDIPAVEAPAPQEVSASAVDNTPSSGHRGSAGKSDNDNGGQSGGRGHRGAA